MARKYIRAHPQSELGRNYTAAHSKGWALVCFVTMYGDTYPIFRETNWRWFKRVFLRRQCWQGRGD